MFFNRVIVNHKIQEGFFQQWAFIRIFYVTLQITNLIKTKAPMRRYIFILACTMLAIISKAQNNNEQLWEQQRKVAYVINAIDQLYVDTLNLPAVVEDLITHLLQQLDPHSAYIPKEELARANESLEGSFTGIGIQFQMLEDTLFVVQTISGCPAEKVGIYPGDRIVMVEDTLIAGVNVKNSQIMRMLRGKKGTTVRVKVQREGVKEWIDFSIVRDKIPIHSMDAAYMVKPEIGYIKINNFGATTLQEFQDGWKMLKKKGAKQLVLDLQGNGGGYLVAAIGLADEFLSEDKLVVYTQGEHQARSAAKSTSKGGFEQGNLVILVDEYSASASEIVSGAVQDWDRGVVVGRRTFGKGLVQRQMALPDGSAIRLTTARYYTPTGRCIQKPYKGVDYQKDLEQRFKHGELMHADSIHFPDSLEYLTLVESRTVYGGGGIMPDIFVPADTTRYTTYHRNLLARGVINRFCVQYIDKHREALKKQYTTAQKIQKEFVITENMWQQLVSMGEKEDIKANQEQLEQSKRYLSLQLKALIARDLLGNQAYFEVINEENDALKEAVQLLQNKEKYNEVLKGKK